MERVDNAVTLNHIYPIETAIIVSATKSKWFRHTHLRRIICYRIRKLLLTEIQSSIKSVATK